MKQKWSKRQIKAIKASIKHWEKDIVKPFEHSYEIVGSNWFTKGEDRLKLNDTFVKSGDGDCPLCESYYNNNCINCPLEITNNGCHYDGSSYGEFDKDPALENAKAMVKALESLLED